MRIANRVTIFQARRGRASSMKPASFDRQSAPQSAEAKTITLQGRKGAAGQGGKVGGGYHSLPDGRPDGTAPAALRPETSRGEATTSPNHDIPHGGDQGPDAVNRSGAPDDAPPIIDHPAAFPDDDPATMRPDGPEPDHIGDAVKRARGTGDARHDAPSDAPPLPEGFERVETLGQRWCVV